MGPGAGGDDRCGAVVGAVRLSARWGFDVAGLAGIHWRAEVGNVASRRVAEACGWRIEGTVRGLLVHRGVRVDGSIGTLLPGELVG